ncbi:dihydrodipicolinate synthase family protein [Pelagovum pacificum]|uniref:Dihydrodipicolinate synthase family protein n=1 Tax=Pelagovum pacificum TaxID=2588711 RepID=A0A5C5GC43_9RHOB|nr:dihydrodipicolinate synthase family protein [Pelagovum pacificum]QQA42470.1 dihydrodipicolinate synthase family protein [Pelagovum pacificum]TNY31552.1 dihydrodipicolinate synthase family protein [Pelagovum pacificum]
MKGVYCAAATPLNADLSPDTGRLADHCRQLLEDGCHGVALLGSTGEANSFSVSERTTMLESVVKAGLSPETLMPGTGVANLPETVELTRHALSLGVTTVVMLPPFYYKEPGDAGVVESYCRVLDEVDDDRLRVVLYHIPQFSQTSITPKVIEDLTGRYPQTVVGMKDSAGNLDRMIEIAGRFPGFDVLSGADPLMLPLLKAGCAGCITATSNLLSTDLRFIYDNYANDSRRDDVDAAQARVVSVRELSNRHAQIPTIKTMVGGRYDDSSWRRVRTPLMPLPEDDGDAICSDLRALMN